MNVIHKDFTTFSDTISSEHMKKQDLSAFGFNQNVVPEMTDMEIKYADSYRRIGCSFLTEEQVEFLCFKHDLFWSPVENFTGIVPNKNANDIVEFFNETVKNHNIKLVATEEEFSTEEQKYDTKYFWKDSKGEYHNISLMGDDHILNIYHKLSGKNIRNSDVRRRYESIHAEAALRGLIGGSVYLESYLDEDYIDPKQSIMVVATRELFKPELATQHGKRKLSFREWARERAEQAFSRTDDPIVLAKVKEGYLVVTYWDINEEL